MQIISPGLLHHQQTFYGYKLGASQTAHKQVFPLNALHSSQTHIFIVNGQVPQLRCLRSSRGSQAAPGHFDEASSLMSHSL